MPTENTGFNLANSIFFLVKIPRLQWGTRMYKVKNNMEGEGHLDTEGFYRGEKTDK